MHKDEAEGQGKKLAGNLKEGLGKLTGDKKLQSEGQADQAEGAVQDALGQGKQALRDALKK